MAIRVGLFGAGWAARTAHGPSLADYMGRKGHGIVLAGVCDLDAAKADEVRAMFGFERAWDSPRAMIREGKLDTAVVAVHVDANAKVARLCVDAGLPTLLEKPPALSRRAVEALAWSVRPKRGGRELVQVAFNRHWTPSVLALKQAIEKSAKGPIRFLSCQFRRAARRDPDFSTTAIHAIDALRFLAGSDYARLDLIYSPGGPAGEVTDYRLQGEMACGATVQMEFSPMAGHMLERYTVQAGGKSFLAHYARDESGSRIEIWSGDKMQAMKVRLPGLALHQLGGFDLQIAAFLDAVRKGGKLPGPTVGETVQTIAVMEALRQRRRRFTWR
ncbi:MAG: Gfo/Idh/MocA family oxidoreductase [Planctomycetes bacterium]|nr:Gfo/Idh/MocA family oxidoreductase [Planctomycetota bacterium]